jgi:Domain of unknown function (DUF4395)
MPVISPRRAPPRTVAGVRRLFSFPNPVNETAARTVAAIVVLLCALTLATGWLWLTVPLAYGFLARVLSGPTLSPVGQFATRVIAPRLPGRLVPGPPKRFAQGMGATMSVAAVVAHFGFGIDWLAYLFVGAITVAAILESAFAICLGCHAFALLMKTGIVPESVCLECADISRRLAVPAA